MNNILSIIKKEINHYFASFVAYVVLFVFLFVGGYYFYIYVFEVRDAARVMPFFLNFMGFLAFLLTPFITMRLFSEEKKTGTIELLLTSPITETQIILGKFFGALLLFLIYTSFTLYYLIILFIFGRPDIGPIITGYIGFILLESAYIAIGILLSLTTKNQIVSGILTLIALLVFWIIGWIGNYFGRPMQDILQYLSFLKHFEDFTKGIIDSKHVIFYLTVIGFNLFLSVRLLESRETVK
ncbi:MAG: ABC transporter permease subunit [Spirochaetes bacterium]|nr:ABC transporter permease subunit [Spirochaetota bacterium]